VAYEPVVCCMSAEELADGLRTVAFWAATLAGEGRSPEEVASELDGRWAKAHAEECETGCPL
jgi:hypothetical protein